MFFSMTLNVLLLLLLGFFFLKQKSRAGRSHVIAPGGVTRSTSTVAADGSRSTAAVLILERHSLDDVKRYLEKHGRKMPALYRLLDMYEVDRKFPDMSDFRLGPNMFEKILLDWIVFVDAAGNELIGHGVTTRIDWDQNVDHLPDGWQGAVRASYQDVCVDHKQPNTLVGLFILVEDRFRQHGWANNIIEEMRRLGRTRSMASLIIPLRPPLRYQKEYADMPMTEFAALKREDGQPTDHWIRLHTRLGAKIIGVSDASHQHALPLKDFYRQIAANPIARSGYTLVQQRDGGWYKAYVDLEHEFVLIRQGCVWVQHPLSASLDIPA